MKINKAELQQALETVKSGLASKEIIEQSTSFAFLKGRAITYNDEISISCPVPGLDLEGAVRAEELFKLLTKVTTDEITLEVNGGEIQVHTGRILAGLPLQQEITLPLEEVGSIPDWTPLPDGLLDALKFTQFTCSRDMSRPVLTCIHVDGDEGVVESSDNHRITRYRIKGMEGFSFLIPASVIPALMQINPVRIAMGEGWVHFQAKNEATFSSRVLEGVFPDIAPHIKVLDGVEITFPVGLPDVLERAAIFASRDSVTDEAVEITLAENRMVIRGEGEKGWFEESLNHRYPGESVGFKINPAFLQQALKGLRKCTKGERTLLFEGETWKHAVALFKE